MGAHYSSMSTRTLFAIFLAIAVLFAPGVTGAAMAAAPHHDMQMMEAGHCQSPPANSGHHDRTDGKSCCIAMCMALAVAPSAPAELSPPRQQMAQFARPKTYRGLPAEIATPPPRRF
jgi:hypothetical protein